MLRIVRAPLGLSLALTVTMSGSALFRNCKRKNKSMFWSKHCIYLLNLQGQGPELTNYFRLQKMNK